MESTSGLRAVFTRVSSLMDIVQGTVCGRGAVAIATSMRVTTVKTRSRATAFILGWVEISTKGTTLMICETAMAKCTGKTAATTKDNGEKVARKAREFYSYHNKA